MGATSAGRRTIKSNSNSPERTSKEALSARQIKHIEEENDKRLKSMPRQVLDELLVRDVVSWNAVIAGYAQHGQGQEALACFHRMQGDGVLPDAITYACILKACGILQDVDRGEQIHNEVVSQGLLEKSVVLCSAVVDMYAKCGVLLKAQKVFDELPLRDAVSWDALIAGYAQHGQGEKALGCLQRMQSEDFLPNVVSWTALIGGYGQQGLAKEALHCFHLMEEKGISSDAITFVNVLNACSRSGLVDEGQMHFHNMKEKYGIIPNAEHYTCMVDLFGRTRLFDKALRVIMMMPSSDYPPVWSALLGACRKWGNVKLGKFAFERATQLDGCNAAAYVFMTNIYAAVGMHEEVENIEFMRMNKVESRKIHAKLQDLEFKLSRK
ncbi:hypothetical protein L7F22_050384 [Adiantum nelumboides]|nr:hypothetical protein [Adiantum nelumboides]